MLEEEQLKKRKHKRAHKMKRIKVEKPQDHIAVMRKSWDLMKKILCGEKNIESRWYKNRYQPWNKIKAGDRVFFKNSGEPVTLKAQVKKVLQFEKLSPPVVKDLLLKFGRDDGLGKCWKDYESYYKMFKDKRYCIIIFLSSVKKVKPFEVNKKGYGAMSAWMVVGDIDRVRCDNNCATL